MSEKDHIAITNAIFERAVSDRFFYSPRGDYCRPTTLVGFNHKGHMYAIPYNADDFMRLMSSQSGRFTVGNYHAMISEKLKPEFGFDLDPQCSRCRSRIGSILLDGPDTFESTLNSIREFLRTFASLCCRLYLEAPPYDEELERLLVAHYVPVRNYTNMFDFKDTLISAGSAILEYNIEWPTDDPRKLNHIFNAMNDVGLLGALYRYMKNSFPPFVLGTNGCIIKQSLGNSWCTSSMIAEWTSSILATMRPVCSKCRSRMIDTDQLSSSWNTFDTTQRYMNPANAEIFNKIWGSMYLDSVSTSPFLPRTEIGVIPGRAAAMSLFKKTVESVYPTPFTARCFRCDATNSKDPRVSYLFLTRTVSVEEEKKEKHKIFRTVDGFVCNKCFKETYSRCDACKKWVNENTLYLKNYVDKKGNNVGSSLCGSCHSVHTHNHPKVGLLYGSEIEVVTPNCLDSQDELFRKISRELSSRNRNMLYWTRDGSLTGPCPMEIITAPCTLEQYRDLVVALTDAFDKYGTTINSSCGYHIHIGGDITWMDAALLYEFCLKTEAKFFNRFPSRRNNSFCRRIPRSHMLIDGYRLRELTRKCFFDTVFGGVSPMQENLASAYRMFEKYRPTGEYAGDRHLAQEHRYSWANFYSFLYRKTVEIRLHPGTDDGYTMYEWVSGWDEIVKSLRQSGREFIGRS